MLRSKFRGSLVGALIGDCFGAPYENEAAVSKRQLQSYFEKLDGPYFKGPYKPYTDDTAMTKCIASSLVANKDVNPTDLAKRFVTEYKNSPRRGYGQNVVVVFEKLLLSKFADPFGPAKEQFDGRGSHGNGAAMRIAPVSLFYHNDRGKLIEMVRKVSSITHSHKLGINGAVLQSLTIQKCLQMNPEQKIDVQNFASDLIKEMKEIERDETHEELNLEPRYSYENQLMLMLELLKKERHPSNEEVVESLGNYVSGIFSVPTAIYSFLKAQNSIPDIDTDNPFRRTIQYAISLGGDTDTIASMAGAIAGAYFGHEIIGESMQKHCEYINETIESADSLFSIAVK
ncbi:UNVERIFIED_CONTAM: hypothetical protein PYX00_007680 [Menopon gallinae]